ncbi:hypothetical protein AMTR_s00095p00050910 [Amborella trichopoda]|uniref:Uncharacterized protein n=1 Tax=Amborella trichopoda TaxID=13333 RepID=W1NP45_AMBTC|nr:hypothetical protein AMTR_s00095p00050910 [Amborella trichopoda]
MTYWFFAGPAIMTQYAASLALQCPSGVFNQEFVLLLLCPSRKACHLVKHTNQLKIIQNRPKECLEGPFKIFHCEMPTAKRNDIHVHVVNSRNGMTTWYATDLPFATTARPLS